MTGVLEAVSLVLSLTQAASQLMTAATDIGVLVENARKEGRDLTDAELDVVRNAALASRHKLAS